MPFVEPFVLARRARRDLRHLEYNNLKISKTEATTRTNVLYVPQNYPRKHQNLPEPLKPTDIDLLRTWNENNPH